MSLRNTFPIKDQYQSLLQDIDPDPDQNKDLVRELDKDLVLELELGPCLD